MLAVAEQSTIDEISGVGFTVTRQPMEAQVVAPVSFDCTFDYEELNAAFQAVRYGGAVIVATNPDPYCPYRRKAVSPTRVATRRGGRASRDRVLRAPVVGKPSVHMARALLSRLGTPAGDVAVGGDRLLTDIAMARALWA